MPHALEPLLFGWGTVAAQIASLACIRLARGAARGAGEFERRAFRPAFWMAAAPVAIGLLTLALVVVHQANIHEFARLRHMPRDQAPWWCEPVGWGLIGSMFALPIALIVSLSSFVVYPVGLPARYIPKGRARRGATSCLRESSPFRPPSGCG